MKAQQKIYIIIAAFALAILCLMVGLVYPILGDIQNAAGQIASNKNGLVTLDAESKALDNFKDNYSQYDSNLQKIDQLFVDAQNPIDFIKFLEKTAADSGITIDISLSQDQGQVGGSAPSTAFQLYTKGSFLDTLHFSEKIESGPYLISMRNLTVKKSQPLPGQLKDTSGKVDANFLLQVAAK